MTIIKRIGFACKFSELDAKGQVVSVPNLNTGTTTVAWLNRQSRAAAEQRLWELMVHNIESTLNLVKKIGTLDDELRMVRLSSDILPVYTHSDWRSYWQRPDVVAYCESGFAQIGQVARNNRVRLSFHPGQFVVLASDNADIVARSIEEFEYHATMARWMGYGQQFQDMKINVHIAGRVGAEGIRAVYPKLSTEARNTITIENEEMKHGLDECLSIADLVPIVLDIHHNWVREGTYISPDSEQTQRVIDSWRGVRPTCHYSVSREDVLVNHLTNVLPDRAQLLAEGYKKSKLRAHSDFMWNTAVNLWALSFLEYADIMVEAKGKNIASFALYEQAKTLSLV